MVCDNCNTRNNYYHHYCYNCGSKLRVSSVKLTGGAQAASAAGIVLNKQRTSFNTNRQHKAGKKRMVVLLILSSAALICIACFIFFRK